MKMKKHEHESFAQHKQRKEKGQRGKSSEDKVQEILSEFKAKHMCFDFDRVYDTRSAGRTLPSGESDLSVFCDGQAVALEVKEVKEGWRLDKFVQLPRIHRRSFTGVLGCVLVHLLEPGLWILVSHLWLCNDINAASWRLDVPEFIKYKSAREALKDLWKL